MSHYCIVRFEPDVFTGEFVNVGIVATDGARTVCRWLADFARAEAFVGPNVERVTRQIAEDFRVRDVLTVDELRALHQRWRNSVRLTEPRGSILSVDQLADDIAARFLKVAPRPRTKGASVSETRGVALFSDDFRMAAALADSVLVGCEPLNSVVFYDGPTTVTILNTEAVPAFLTWFADEIAAGRWRDGGGNPLTAGRHFDRVAATPNEFEQRCRRCGATGDSRDEFLSPYTGLCAACDPRSASNTTQRKEPT